MMSLQKRRFRLKFEVEKEKAQFEEEIVERIEKRKKMGKRRSEIFVSKCVCFDFDYKDKLN